MFNENPFAPTKTPRDQINEILAKIIVLFDEATAIADRNDLRFSWDHFGYGFSGAYVPKPMSYDDALAVIASGDDITPDTRKKIVNVLREGRDGWESSDAHGWVSSSANC